MGANTHGIPKLFVEASVKFYYSCDNGKWKLPRPLQVNILACAFQLFNERHTMLLANNDHLCMSLEKEVLREDHV
jgi:hypothetical protein